MLKLSTPSRLPKIRSPPLTADKRVSMKYRKAHIRKLKEKEYRRLKAVLPALTSKDRVSKVAVIEEAIKYIDELHQALVERVQAENDSHVDASLVTTMAQQLFNQTKSRPSQYTSTPTSRYTRAVLCERNRPLPTPQSSANILRHHASSS